MGRRAMGVEIVNPARAGMIPNGGAIAPHFEGKPRASGDDPARKVADALAAA